MNKEPIKQTELKLVDENGKLLPYDEIEKQFHQMYIDTAEDLKNIKNIENLKNTKNMEKENENRELLDETNEELLSDSILSFFTDPECSIDSESVFDTFSFVDRSLYLTTEITHEHAIAFSDAIRFWNYIDRLDGVPENERTPIKIYIDTPGGDLDATFSIIDSITLSKTPVWTITIGSGSSGGFFVGIAGHKRIGYPNSVYLFHEGSCQMGADAHKYLQFGKFYETRLASLKHIVLERTQITPDEYKKHRKDDLYMTAKDALRYGVIDEITNELV